MKRRLVRTLPAVAVLLYCLPVLIAGLGMKFAPDDMMNIHKYWSAGLAKTALGNLQFWSTFYRPLGGVFYLSIFPWAGLDPLPYRVALMFFYIANALLAFEVARLLTRSRWVGAIAAILAWYNYDTFDTLHATASLYDVLCYSFFLGAMAVYIRGRRSGFPVSGMRTAIVAVLFIAALNSKEIGVALPVVLCAYELVYHGARVFTVRRVLLPLALLAGMAALYSYGKMTGPDSLRDVGAYTPVFTLGHFLDNNAGFAASLVFHRDNRLAKGVLLGLWAAILYLGFRRRDPALRFVVPFVVAVSLPIAFIPRRGGSSIYLLWFGYAVAEAAVAARLIRFLSREPLWRWLHVPRLHARMALTAALVVVLFVGMQKDRAARTPIMLAEHHRLQAIIDQTTALNPHPRPGALVLFLNDPFELHDMHFIAALTFRDPTVRVVLQRMHPEPLDPAKADHVFTFENGKLRLLR